MIITTWVQSRCYYRRGQGLRPPWKGEEYNTMVHTRGSEAREKGRRALAPCWNPGWAGHCPVGLFLDQCKKGFAR